jgi:hypothetical protein
MHGVRILSLAALVFMFAATAPVAQAGTYPQNHDGWSIGFGAGGGSAGVSVDGGGSSDRESGGMGNFRLGYPLNEQVSLALEGNAWTKSENGATVTFSATTFGVAFFPSEGLVLRGGVGFGSTTVAADLGPVTVTSTESGLGLHGAVGYDFRLARTFAIGPQADFGYASFDGGSANWFGVGVQFNWYFVPKS